jgi:hypothetical protein
MISDFIYILAAVFVGAIIAWLASRYYYVRVGKDLERETSELIQKINLILRGMEEGGLIEWTKDEQGNAKGIVRKSSGSINAKSELHGKATIKEP